MGMKKQGVVEGSETEERGWKDRLHNKEGKKKRGKRKKDGGTWDRGREKEMDRGGKV